MNLKLIKIHGTSGSGKTTIVRDLMEYASRVDKMGDNPNRPSAYWLSLPGFQNPVVVLGSYESTCGGMDSITCVQTQIDLIHKYYALGAHVIYEGLLLSTYYGKPGKAVECYGQDHIWAFLDTPIDVCIERVKKRRLEAGNTKPLNERNTRERVRPIMALRTRLIRMGAHVVTLNHDDTPANQVMDLMEGPA
jgi:thymidylate kinase